MTPTHNCKSDTYDKILGCWLGKSIGGTLGMPFEGTPDQLHLTHYNPVPTRSVPNDDLELQLLWLKLIEEHGMALRASDFATIWQQYSCDMDEYAVARWNLRRGLVPPLTGLHNNWFTDGMGAAIRSEIWACLFPGNPKMAAKFAREDACVDHHGNGIYAEMFLAAAESIAFGTTDRATIVQQALSFIPSDCRIAKAVNYAWNLADSDPEPNSARISLLRQYGSHNFTDVSMNLAFMAYALNHGGGDFAKTLLTAVNFGMDTDCTGATMGSLLGIIIGADAIPDDWKGPIGESIAVSDFLADMKLPKTASLLTNEVMILAEQLEREQETDNLPPWTAPIAEDSIHDHNSWLLFTVPLDDGMYTPPAAWEQAANDPAACIEALVDFPGIHLDLGPYLPSPGASVYLLTWLSVPDDCNAHLLLCADTGMTAWLDGRQILNYHGRQKALPAAHRTEGGSTVPIKLEGGRLYRLQVRLTGCYNPTSFHAALTGDGSRYIDDTKFTVPTIGDQGQI